MRSCVAVDPSKKTAGIGLKSFGITDYTFFVFLRVLIVSFFFRLIVSQNQYSDPKGLKAAAKAKEEAAKKKKKKAAAGGLDAMDDLLSAGLSKGKGKKKK